MSTAIQHKTEKWVGLTATLIFHGIIVLLLFWFALTTPDPPLTGGEGMVVNLGYVDESTGDIQPMSENQSQPIVTKQQMQQSEDANEKIVTQSIEETEKINTSDKATDKVVEKTTETVAEPTPQEPVEEKKTVDPRTLYPGKKNNSISQGQSDKGKGDQGDPNGDPNSKNYGKNTGDGNDPNNGSGSNKGPSYSMEGRKAKALPTPQFNIQEEGKVVVEIYIDKEGNVTRANPGIRGSTTTNSVLLAKAKESALRAKFSSNADAPEEQRGTIVYNFLLK